MCGIFKILGFVVILSESFKRIKLYNVILAGLNSVWGFLFKILGICNFDWRKSKSYFCIKITYTVDRYST